MARVSGGRRRQDGGGPGNRLGRRMRWSAAWASGRRDGDWIAPELGKQKFREYAEQWMRDRVLKPRSAELYDGLLKNHLYSNFGDLGLIDVDEATIRRWRKARLEAGPKAKRPFGPVTVAKAYRLLHAIFETAAEDDRFIPRNPCHIDGAGKEESDERQIVPLPVVFEIAKAVPVRYRALVLLATFADMRWGELAGLRRENLDLDACEIRIKETLSQPDKGGLRPDTPKSQAGKRIVSFPEEIAPEIRWHLERFAEPGERGFVFVGPKGGQLRRSNFHKSVWIKARAQVGLNSLHFHDLRHTGGTLTAATGATLKELMARLGHSSVRAAMIYQHATRDRDQAIAKALGTFVRDVRNAAENQPETGEREEKGA